MKQIYSLCELSSLMTTQTLRNVYRHILLSSDYYQLNHVTLFRVIGGGRVVEMSANSMWILCDHLIACLVRGSNFSQFWLLLFLAPDLSRKLTLWDIYAFREKMLFINLGAYLPYKHRFRQNSGIDTYKYINKYYYQNWPFINNTIYHLKIMISKKNYNFLFYTIIYIYNCRISNLIVLKLWAIKAQNYEQLILF